MYKASTFAFRRLISNSLKSPPSHFSNPNDIPSTYTNNTSRYGSESLTTHDAINNYNNPTFRDPQKDNSMNESPPGFNQSNANEGSLKEVTTLIAMFALAYIAIDNYTSRIKIDKLHQETTAINLKALQIQQLNYQKDKKHRDLQILQERKEGAKRQFKMSLHIAMLRKQLKELGVEPIEMDKVVKEFESSVKADNSMKNVSGQYLWIDDLSQYKNYLPDPMEYDKSRRKD